MRSRLSYQQLLPSSVAACALYRQRSVPRATRRVPRRWCYPSKKRRNGRRYGSLSRELSDDELHVLYVLYVHPTRGFVYVYVCVWGLSSVLLYVCVLVFPVRCGFTCVPPNGPLALCLLTLCPQAYWMAIGEMNNSSRPYVSISLSSFFMSLLDTPVSE